MLFFFDKNYSIQPAFLVIPCSNLEHVHRNTWKILTRKAVSFEELIHINIIQGQASRQKFKQKNKGFVNILALYKKKHEKTSFEG